MAKSKADQRIEALENEVASLKETIKQLFDKVNQTKPKFWWEGGNLHNVTLQDWVYASEANRLASASDYIHAFMKIDEYEHQIDYQKNPNLLLTAYAAPLVQCINEIAYNPDNEDLMKMPMAWVASACAFQLGFVKVNAVVKEINEAHKNEIVKKVAAIVAAEGGEINA